jgi:hypothetical protein
VEIGAARVVDRGVLLGYQEHQSLFVTGLLKSSDRPLATNQEWQDDVWEEH